MNKLLIAAAACGIAFASTSLSVKANDAIAEGLCTAISADDHQRLRTILGNHNLRLRNIYNSVRCNGYSMLQFAITAEAANVGEMITRQLPASTIENDTVNGQPMLEWAETSGYASSPVVESVRARING
ncbi:DUF3718 domain-containing protein [Aliidiomarina sp. Khilg15.8]